MKFIKKTDEDDEQFWLNIIDTPIFFAWASYAFEMVCLHHISQIKKALGINGVQTVTSTWQTADAQIDLVLDRKDQVINICEMKFSVHPFVINKKYADNLRNKLNSFRQKTNTRKSLFLTFLTTYGVAQNKHSGMVRNDLEMGILFE